VAWSRLGLPLGQGRPLLQPRQRRILSGHGTLLWQWDGILRRVLIAEDSSWSQQTSRYSNGLALNPCSAFNLTTIEGYFIFLEDFSLCRLRHGQRRATLASSSRFPKVRKIVKIILDIIS